MAGAWSPISRRVLGSTVIDLSRSNSRTGGSLPVRISARSHGVSTCEERETPQGPSCIFVGPVETASKETLEALYRQARDSYYSGMPLIVDDMFDRVELRLRWYGSKHVVKYPRCSLRRHSTYADAEEDPSQVFALASVWLLILGFGSSFLIVPLIYTIVQAYQDTFDSGMSYTDQSFELFTMLNGILFMVLGSIIGFPIASASVGALQGLWKNDLVALKGACPNCGEEVFAFLKAERSNHSPHRADCHVCESRLEFQTNVEQSSSRPGRRWVYGRVYLIRQRQRWA
ncbi:hypothetical protein FXO38_17109 [Capsicum annuum]|uniref:PGR5-like protein 1B, chloroplastic n=1 Tax=Capsicum annuum TaxID=4072 RepID=A0A1U8H2R5_CAPAN|nr:uncharacterized protein LOC107875530 isoform X2 [Capsicum annuum]KAF3650497.1 hypothetical protein FXO38_17109 [Capsicum annuum]PHT80214.1 hypothetical protein T459_18266 [Capsicum annuum]